MYSSTKECLHYSYPKISKGGYIYIDDYWAFPACQVGSIFYTTH